MIPNLIHDGIKYNNGKSTTNLAAKKIPEHINKIGLQTVKINALNNDKLNKKTDIAIYFAKLSW